MATMGFHQGKDKRKLTDLERQISIKFVKVEEDPFLGERSVGQIRIRKSVIYSWDVQRIK